MKNKILIVVDMQNDFIDGSLGTKEAQTIIPAVIERIRKAREEGWDIRCTLDTHNSNYLDTAEGIKLPVLHCVYGTIGHNMHPMVSNALAGYPYITYNKDTFGSISLASDLLSEVSNSSISQKDYEIELIGLCTDICVVSNALLLKAMLPSAKISVNKSCCAGVTPEKHEAALKTMESCQIDII